MRCCCRPKALLSYGLAASRTRTVRPPHCCGALTEVTDIFTTALPVCTGNRNKHTGEQAKPALSRQPANPSPFGVGPNPRHARLLLTDSTAQAWSDCLSEKYPVSSPPTCNDAAQMRGKISKRISSRRSRTWRAVIANLGSPWHRSPAQRLVPSAQAPRFGRARFRASPRIRVSRIHSNEPRMEETKNPPEPCSGGSEIRTDDVA